MSVCSRKDDRRFEAVSNGDLAEVRSYPTGDRLADPERIWEPGPNQMDGNRLADAASIGRASG
mgnify:CR=1 FL=1